MFHRSGLIPSWEQSHSGSPAQPRARGLPIGSLATSNPRSICFQGTQDPVCFNPVDHGTASDTIPRPTPCEDPWIAPVGPTRATLTSSTPDRERPRPFRRDRLSPIPLLTPAVQFPARVRVSHEVPGPSIRSQYRWNCVGGGGVKVASRLIPTLGRPASSEMRWL